MIRDCDGHPIHNLNSGQPLIGEKPITIGNHVWIGSEATIMKGAKIPDDSVVGWGSLVTHDLTTYRNVVIAGRPAKVIKEEIRWEH